MKTAIYTSQYPGFEHPVSSLSKFICAGNLFTIMLKNGKIIHSTPIDKDSFMQWLLNNQVTDIKSI